MDTGRKLNIRKTFKRSSGRLLNILYMFSLRPSPRRFRSLLHLCNFIQAFKILEHRLFFCIGTDSQWFRKLNLLEFLAWGAWEPWRECNETCGSHGMRERVRYCIKPVPTNGGGECRGNSSDIEPCNRELCPSNSFCSSITPKFV